MLRVSDQMSHTANVLFFLAPFGQKTCSPAYLAFLPLRCNTAVCVCVQFVIFFSVAECAERERLYVKTKNRIYLIFFLLVLIQVFCFTM